MRIGLDGFPLLSPRTGVGHYTFELARALAQLSPSDQFELIAPRKFPRSILDDLRNHGPVNLRVVNPPMKWLYRQRWWSLGLPLYVKQKSYDLFHGTNYEVPLWEKARNVLTIHDLSDLRYPQHHEPHLVRRAQKRLPLMVRSAAVIVTPTETVKREVIEEFEVDSDKIIVTPEAPRRDFRPATAAKIEEVKRRLRINDEFILFVGTLEPRKNLLTLLKAFELILRETVFRPQLVLAGGEGWLMDEFLDRVQNFSAPDRLRLTGYLPDHELSALYSACRVFVYPSLYEGFGLPPVEAMACGGPVIASKIAVFEETLGSAASLVDPMNETELAESITKILKDENYRSELSKRGRERVRELTWERTARLTREAYQRIV